ncbi:MAG: hypothetical protein CL527_06205 [Aequorivita sp.]|uniref:Uncharacterized protein n=1 Tax=Aequorivita vladivostokensis TaxID=171194 RepID=A0ABR5DJ26_9FLAO|nr:hypothetical protein MB09_08875 [Aequorivita vladivostokensis]MAB58029.1 hypothetical protein [Aequorivita sp.]MAO48295.1 hypothetical protein [Aequorivita sp.]MBF30170.1 hypothetical protein [Aequorivita sp.]HAV55041.1 hypothetical protein [Aequorivita sp.]
MPIKFIVELGIVMKWPQREEIQDSRFKICDLGFDLSLGVGVFGFIWALRKILKVYIVSKVFRTQIFLYRMPAVFGISRI